LANLSFRKNEIDQGIAQFKKLFEKRRDHYDALYTLIRFLSRAGKIDESQYFFDKIVLSTIGAIGISNIS
jgi:hypothetical protein